MKTRFKEARKKRWLTQKQVAQMLHISHTTYNRYESGLIEPSMSTLCMLSEIFETSIDFLLMRNEPCQESELYTQEDLLLKYNRLDSRGKQAVWGTLMREYEFQNLGV